MKIRFGRSAFVIVLCIVLGILLALQMKGLNRKSVTRDSLQELQNSVIEYQKKNQDLDRRNNQLHDYIRTLENELSGSETGVLAKIIEEKEQYAVFAGLRKVENDGVIISLTSNAPARMRDSVLRQFVNELASLGAQAVSINGERKVATTEIRANDDQIIINGVRFDRNDTFEIRAIVNPDSIDEYIIPYLENVRGVILKELEGENWTITIKHEKKLVIPALREDRIAYQNDLLVPVE
ncbi:MAG: DUF881 domain-containing protein [Saccharofermentanales bacterium]|jgi:uncharacterized protein YlxW (UPF0749 family)|nr:DUF881 domain-containing protein [Bacillota bacterium]